VKAEHGWITRRHEWLLLPAGCNVSVMCANGDRLTGKVVDAGEDGLELKSYPERLMEADTLINADHIVYVERLD
jgi:hypothetical protein